jgi:hypothetical protein
MTKEKTAFWELDLFSSSGDEETHTLSNPLERVNLNHWTETGPVSEML